MNTLRAALFFDPDSVDQGTRLRAAQWMEAGVLVCLVILAAGLPFAGITFSRELGLLLGLAFWLARLVLIREWDLVRTPLDLPLALFLAAGLLSLVTAVDPGYTLHELRGEMIKGILIYYLAVNNLRTESRARVVLWALLAGALIMDLYGVAHFFVQGGSLLGPEVQEASLHRGNHELATYLIQVGPYLLLGLFLIQGRPHRAALVLFLVLHCFLAHATFARIVIVALAVEIALVIFLLGVSWKIILTVLALALLVAAVALPRPILVLGDKKYEGLTRFGEVGVLGLKGSRADLWEKSLVYLKKYPFSGVGFGRRSWTKAFPEMRARHPNFWHGHNTFLNLAVELGLQGLAAFGFLLYRILKELWPGRDRKAFWRRSGPPGLLIAGAWIMTCGYFLSNLTDDIYNNDAALLFWLLIGCAFSVKRFALGASQVGSERAGKLNE